MSARVVSPVVVIDPGHGGDRAVGGSSPNNAKGPNGLLEKNLTLDIARRVHKILSRSATVLLTRDNDSNLSLADRAKLARDKGAKMFLSIHMNGFPDASVDGTEVWVARQASKASERFAESVLERLAAATGVKNRGLKRRDLGVLLPARHAPETAACLAEVAFLSNPEQARRLKDDNYLQSIANALAEAVYLGLGGRLTPAQSLAAAVGGYGSALAQVEFAQWANSGSGAQTDALEWDEYIDDERGGDAPAGALFLAPPLTPKPPPALNAWAKLINFRPPTSVQKALNKRGIKGWHVHHIEDANGPINLDYYPVKVTTLPTFKGRQLTAETLLNHVRGNLTDFGNKKIAEFDPINQNDHDKFYSDDPVGAVLTIRMKLGGKIGPEDGSVVVSEYSPQHWIFSTAWTTEDFDHPVSGNREFGFKEQEGGGYVFYTRGADRATGMLDAAMSDGVFNTAHALWSSLQEGIADFVNDNGGKAAVENPSSRRYDWDEVQRLYFKPTTTWTFGLSDAEGEEEEEDEGRAYSLGGGDSPCAKLKPRVVLDKFEYDSDKVLPAHELKLIDIAKCVIARKKGSDPVDSMLIVGHTDEKGEEKYNKGLGQRRAERVKSHLVAALDRILPGSSRGIAFIVDSGGEAEPASTVPEANRRVEVCLPYKLGPPPPPPPADKPRPTLPDIIKRCEQVLATQTFPAAQKERLQCVLKKLADETVDASYINGKWDMTRYFAGGKFPRLSPKDFARFMLFNARRDIKSKLFAGADLTDEHIAMNLNTLDENVLSGIKLVEKWTHRNAELNWHNPVLRQMQEFITGLQRGAQPSIYTCYREVPK